ncbi:copper resistance protein CopC [Nocardioides zeae]
MLSAGAADAHTALVSSDPPSGTSRATAPTAITLQFSEPMDPDLSTVALTIDGTSRGTLHTATGRAPISSWPPFAGPARRSRARTPARAWRGVSTTGSCPRTATR